MNKLSFEVLRQANAERLPQFKNCHGGAAHTKPDGSDWSPAQWLAAMFGEIGEWAQVRIDYESGRLTEEEFQEKNWKEIADAATYMDIWARRSCDKLGEYKLSAGDTAILQGYPFDNSPAETLMYIIAALGDYANSRKKYDRGDYTLEEYALKKDVAMHVVRNYLEELERPDIDLKGKPHPGDVVRIAHPDGVDLGQAVTDKFNLVSQRVNCDVWILSDGTCAYWPKK
jgi:hypothetical protein